MVLRFKEFDEDVKIKAFCELQNVLNSYAQKFFLIGGAFLGQYREGRFIPWDTDIDIGIFYEDYNNSIENFFSESKSWKLIEVQGEIELCRRLIVLCKKHPIPIDICIHYRVANSRNYFYFCAWYKGYKGKIWPCYKNHIKALSVEPFYNTYCLVPSNAEQYLTESYGDWRKPNNWNEKEKDPISPNLVMKNPRELKGPY